MFKPQGGSLHTDENTTRHVHRFCCMTQGVEKKTKPATKIALREVEEPSAQVYPNSKINSKS